MRTMTVGTFLMILEYKKGHSFRIQLCLLPFFRLHFRVSCFKVRKRLRLYGCNLVSLLKSDYIMAH